ncbi:spore gernimation protein GerPD [Bacillus solimangrovi]|uniref:Spore gernimation protein GerPD n=1 Tax=Bacillus solimangrovi TaxID=1305675 RepID=A0A1E5LC79_9BACI|nr:spore gernimation protein GerPD [Bacillus solimangrovi]OEH91671.1 spore gernimation protein GerPD [Bacillus solimangrovi]
MIFNVNNGELCVNNIQIDGVSTSSVVLIGDTERISLSSTFDTPPESLIIGPFVPFAPE